MPRRILGDARGGADVARVLGRAPAGSLAAPDRVRDHRAVTIVRRAQRLLYLAARDRLTALFNRGHFDPTWPTPWSAVHNGQPFSLALLDIDHFKQIIDGHGHALGDNTLREVAHRLAAHAADRHGRR